MKSVLVIFAIVGVVSVYGSFSLDDLTDMTEALQGSVKTLALEISDASTLNAVGDEYLNEVFDFFLPKINTRNNQHSDLIEKYQGQVKTMQHRVDEAKSQETGSLTLAAATQASLTRMFDYVNGSKVKDITDAQMEDIAQLMMEAASVKADFLKYLDASLENLDDQQDKFRNKLETLEQAVESRKCEYGFKFLDVQENNRVDLKTAFGGSPSVSISLAGFVAHTDLYSKVHDDSLAPKMEVSSVSNDKFYVNVYDNSNGRVGLKYVAASWMACQNLEVKVDLAHEVPNPPGTDEP